MSPALSTRAAVRHANDTDAAHPGASRRGSNGCGGPRRSPAESVELQLKLTARSRQCKSESARRKIPARGCRCKCACGIASRESPRLNPNGAEILNGADDWSSL